MLTQEKYKTLQSCMDYGDLVMRFWFKYLNNIRKLDIFNQINFFKKRF
jgi:hypothetical protein